MARSRWCHFSFNRFLGQTKIQVFLPWVGLITGLVLCQTNIALEDVPSLQDLLVSILTDIVWPSLAITVHHQPSLAIQCPELRQNRAMATIWSGQKTGTRLADRSGSSLTAALLWPVSTSIQHGPTRTNDGYSPSCTALLDQLFLDP